MASLKEAIQAWSYTLSPSVLRGLPDPGQPVFLRGLLLLHPLPGAACRANTGQAHAGQDLAGIA